MTIATARTTPALSGTGAALRPPEPADVDAWLAPDNSANWHQPSGDASRRMRLFAHEATKAWMQSSQRRLPLFFTGSAPAPLIELPPGLRDWRL